MRLVFLSDTHSQHKKIFHPIPDGDVLIHCGDATWEGKQGEIRRFSKWISSLPHEHKIFVPGNHDIAFDKKLKYAKMWLDKSIHLLINHSLELDGIKFFGCSWMKPIEGNTWGFDMPSKSSRRRIYGCIPEDIDVLITHQPAYMVLDQSSNNINEGDIVVRHTLERIKPKIHAHGHIHEAYGTQSFFHSDGCKTICINASICNRDYRPVNSPIVWDI